MKLLLIRGIPGSGKSTLAREWAKQNDAMHCEADHYFETPRGYQYDTSKAREAHDWCRFNADWWLSQGRSVVVANTFVYKADMLAYEALAARYGAELEVVTARGSYESIHSVPPEVVERMRANFQE